MPPRPGPQRPPLPIDAVLDDVVDALRKPSSGVLQAPPGAGKTTRVPLSVLEAGLVDPGGQLLLLEPRRVAARAAAATMARTLGENAGATVGYQVRFDRKSSAATRILVVTEGILTRRFADDAMLEGVSVVILDEFHERSIHTDLCLALVKELQSVRDDLKLIVGVGPVLERMLHQLGVTSYRDIARWSERDIDEFDARLAEFPGRIRRDGWVTQARELHQSKYGEAIGAGARR